jgi:hypothetical protein
LVAGREDLRGDDGLHDEKEMIQRPVVSLRKHQGRGAGNYPMDEHPAFPRKQPNPSIRHRTEGLCEGIVFGPDPDLMARGLVEVTERQPGKHFGGVRPRLQ